MAPKKPRSSGDASPAQTPQTALQYAIWLINQLRSPWRWIALILLFVVVLSIVGWKYLPIETQQGMIDWLVSEEMREVAVGYYPGVFVEHESSILDLSEWTAMRSETDDRCCKATWTYTIKVRRVHEDARYFAKRIATSGFIDDVKSSTHDLVSQPLVPGQRLGGPAMKRYDALLDVSAERLNAPFKVVLATTHYNGFSDNKGEWAALAILQPAACVALKIRFPKHKPPKNLQYKFSTRAPGDNYQALNPQEYRASLSDNLVLSFKIDHPRLGYAYRVDWSW